MKAKANLAKESSRISQTNPLNIQYLYTPMRLGSLEFSLTKVGSLMYFVKALAKNSG